MTTQEAFDTLCADLAPTHGAGEARSIARIVLEDAFQWRPGRRPREWSFEEERRWEAIRGRLSAHEPVQYILGEADFYGLKFMVNPAVLIPRAETEELVAWIIEAMRSLVGRGSRPRMLDVGTGSGCIPLAVKADRLLKEEVVVTGYDCSPEALEVARRNGERLALPANWAERDILQWTSWRNEPRWDVVVSNPPYIPPSEASLLPAQVREYEPDLALFVPESDPLLFYRAIFHFAREHLVENGWLFFECNEFNASEVLDLGHSQGFQGELRDDLQGKARMYRGRVGNTRL